MRCFLILFFVGSGWAAEVRGLSREEVDEAAAEIDAGLEKVMRMEGERGILKMPVEAADEDFLRRLMVDVAGRLPTGSEVREFLEDVDADKRAIWIDKVAALPEAHRWRFRRLADALRVKDEVDGVSLRPYVEWLKGEVVEDVPYDGLVKRLLLAKGSMKEDPAAGYLLSDAGEVRQTVAESMRALLGMDVQCAACHDDPFGDASQRQFYELAGAFNRVVEGDGGKKLAEEPVPTRLPENYQYRNGSPGELVKIAALPVSHFGDKLTGGEWKDGVRVALSEWMAGENNERFQEVAVFRVWQWMFGQPLRVYNSVHRGMAAETPDELVGTMNHCETLGRGLRSPMDIDWGTSDAHKEFWTLLRRQWDRCGRRMGEFQRVLAHTRAYQREVWVPSGDSIELNRFLPAPVLRRLPAEVVWDALAGWAGEKQAWLLPEVLPHGHPLRILGRGGRAWSDSDGGLMSHAVARFMMSGDLIKRATDSPVWGKIRGVEDFFIEILGRMPTTGESQMAEAVVQANGGDGMQDVVWALLNTGEFWFLR
ncbi:DUF1549 domain-containing protein [Phragmitibacter flavus]|uniref:DUF1549 domain-containing protein n=1 Tax=Phragmitibacter flavus TaxID=2576071 RepID=A0A5R8K9W5_9BACT|nr:DUF1549 domain-containing protein [Phragmitibacter flavus]TLD69113.1 DUF1549 domain-containing protein [Phragmitibacter flavus]